MKFQIKNQLHNPTLRLHIYLPNDDSTNQDDRVLHGDGPLPVMGGGIKTVEVHDDARIEVEHQGMSGFLIKPEEGGHLMCMTYPPGEGRVAVGAERYVDKVIARQGLQTLICPRMANQRVVIDRIPDLSQAKAAGDARDPFRD
ncbi:MAG: hypothetical protein AAF552_10855 [Pseudomonadota bacterium]